MANIPRAPAIIPAKPIVHRYATPNLADRIYRVRKDSRLPDYVLPAQGDPYKGPNANKFQGYKFATVAPTEQSEWYDWFYVNERANQDEYNYSIEFPGGDKTKPKVTRSYVFLRDGYVEIADNSPDPVYSGMVLVDRKTVRLEDPILDALFIGVERVYETLPGVPVITKTIGAANLIPEKYRRLVRDIETNQPVSADYVFPPGLTGDQVQVQLAQDSITRARLKILEQVIESDVALVGGKTDIWGSLVIYESIVDEGTAIDEGYLVKDSQTTPLGNGKSIKITVNYPANLASVLLLTKTLGQDNLIPEKYRRLVKHNISNQIVDPDTYVFPTILTGDQSQIEYVQEAIHQARLKIIEEIINTDVSPLIGHELDRWGVLTVEESIVNDGTAVDEGYLILKSSVTPLGNEKSIKITVSYPANLASVILLSKSLGQDNLIPEKYRRLVRHTVSDKLVDADTYVFPSSLTGDQSQIEYIEDTIHRARLKIVDEIIDTDTDPLLGKELDKWGVLTVEESVVDDGTAVDDDYLILKSNVTPLGNGKSIKISVSYPANLASLVLLTKTLGHDTLIPEKYRSLVRHDVTEKLVDADTYVFPASLTGDQTQIEYIEETLHRARLKIAEEIVTTASLIGRELDRWGVLVITESIVNDGTAVDDGYLILKSSVTPLGNGKSIKISVSYPAGLASVILLTKSLGQDNLIPEKYRRLVTRNISDKLVDADTYTFPSVLTGDQSQLEYIEDTIHRARLKIVEEIVNVDTDPLGGGELDKWGTLTIEESIVNDGTAVDTGYLIFKSTVTPLGNGKSIKITVSYPADLATSPLVGQEYDQSLDVVLPYEESLQPAGTGIGVPRTVVEPVTQERELNRIADITTLTSVLNNYLLSFPGTTNIQLPDVLDSIDTFVESRSGEGSFSEIGTAFWTGEGSASLDIRGSGNSSASIMPVATAQISQPWGHNIATMRYMFFLPLPVTAEAVLTKLNAAIDNVVQPWPKFRPVGVTIFCIGEALTLTCEATSKWMSGGSSHGSQGAVSTGAGSSRKLEMTINAIRVPPTLHKNIGSGTLIQQNVDISCEATANASVPSHIEETGTVTGRAYAGITATNPDSIPNEGLFLYDTKVEPYKYGWAMVHCEVIDFADVVGLENPGPIILPPETDVVEVWGHTNFKSASNDTSARLFTLSDGTTTLFLRPAYGGHNYWRFGTGTTDDVSRLLLLPIVANHFYDVNFCFRYDPNTDKTIYICMVDGISIEAINTGGYHNVGSLILDGRFIPNTLKVGSLDSVVVGGKANARTVRQVKLGSAQGSASIFNGYISSGVIVPPFDSATSGITGDAALMIISSSAGIDEHADKAITIP